MDRLIGDVYRVMQRADDLSWQRVRGFERP